MASQTIDILLNPTIDKGKFSAVVESIKAGAGTVNIPATVTPPSKNDFDGASKASEQAGKEAASKFGTTFKDGYKSIASGLEGVTKNALNPILAVFGGNVLTKGFSSLTGSVGDWIEKGKGVLATTNAMQTAFAQTGLSGTALTTAIADTNKVAGKLSNQFAMSVADVREYSKAAAVLGGATGKSNEDLTKLGIAIEKSTNGMISGTMAIRLFSKGVSDPESEFALARLTKQYPALGTALKGLKNPAEVTAKALAFFGPTFKTMGEQSKGALGSFTILQNNLNAVKTAFGSVIIEAIAPFASSFAQTIVPAVQAFTGYIKGFSVYLKPLAPAFVAVGSAAAIMVTSLLAMQGINYVGGLITQGIQLSQTILTKVLPSIFAQTTAEGALVFNTQALTFANIKNMAISKAKLALDYLQSTAIYGLVTGQLALNAAIAANPIGFAIAGAVALGAALYLLYDNVDAVRNVFDTAWGVIVEGAKIAWAVIKSFGSVLAEIGSLVYEVFTVPFQIAWGIISGVGSAIGSLIGSLFGVADGGTMISSVFLVLNQAGTSLINLFDTVKATISGITAVVSSVVGSVTETISQVFSLDFSGAWDSLTGAGDKAAQAFNDSYNAKMRTAKFDEAADAVVKGMEKAYDLEIKIKAKSDFSDTLKAYQETQDKINDLSSKPKASLTKAQTDELDRLKVKAAEYSNEIQKVAPAAVNSMSAIVGANGQITNSYDINIAKATEFSKANDLTSVMETQKNAVSNSVNTMAANYSRQVFAAEKLKKELEKPVTDGKENEKLVQSFNEANKKAEEMKTKLVDNFLKAGQAGLLTQNAVDGVAKGLGITNEAAKNMLISKELEKSADAGVLTEKQISKLSVKYGISKEQVQKIYENQKKITDETKATQQAAENWGSALDRVKKAQSKASEDALSAQLKYKKGLITKEELDEQIKLSEATIKSSNEEMLVMRDANNTIKANKNLRAIGLEDEKKSTSETTKAKKSQYEIDKESFELLKKDQKLAEEKFVREQTTFRLQTGFIATEKSALNDKIEANKRTLADYEAQSKALKTMLSDAEKLPAKDNKRADAIKDVTEKQKELNNELEKTNSDIKNLEVNISIDDAKQRAEFDKLKLDAKNLELESKVKLGFITESEKLTIEIENINIDKSKLQSEIDKIKAQISSSGTNQELENKIQSYQNQILKLDTDIATKQSEQTDKSARERINSIADGLERERQLRLYELQKTYDEEIKQAQGNTQKLLAINMAYNDARNKAEQKYLAETNDYWNAASKLSDAFANIKVTGVDKTAINNLNNTKNSIAAERRELENSYAMGQTDYDNYQRSLSEIQNKESENRIALEQAEADRKKAVWNGFTTAVTGYFTTMYEDYSKKAAESVNKVLQTQEQEYRIKNERTQAQSVLDAAIETNNYTMQAAAKAKIADLENQDTENKKANSEAVSAMYANLAISSSAMFGQLLMDNKSFGQAFLMTALGTLKALIPVLSATILGYSMATPDAIASLGATAVIKWGLLMAGLYGAVGLAESAVMGAFKDGVVNLQGKGSGTSDSNLALLSAGESVITARGTKHGINQKFFNFTNKTGGNLYDFIQADPTIQRDLAKQRIMQNYDTVMKQKDIFDAIVEDYRLNNKNLERSNRELQKNQIALLLKLDEINNTLQTTKIVNSQHNYNLDIKNEVVGALQSTDMFRR